MTGRPTPRTGREGLVFVLTFALTLPACGSDAQDLPPPVGVYVLDRADYARALLAEGVGGAGADRAKAREAARREAARLEIRLALEEDGSFIVRYRFGKERGRYRGAWRREGDRITLVTTESPSGPLGTPETAVARYGRAGLRFERGVVPRPFTLRRE